MIRVPKSDSISEEEFLELYKGIIRRKPSGNPKPKIIWGILLGLLIGGIYLMAKKERSVAFDDTNVMKLFDDLPEQAKEAFIKKYGQPDEDDRDCIFIIW